MVLESIYLDKTEISFSNIPPCPWVEVVLVIEMGIFTFILLLHTEDTVATDE